MIGYVVRLLHDKGFGFIKGHDEKEYFFHHTSLRSPLSWDTIKKGDDVEFDPEDGPKGPRTSRVTEV